MQPENKNDSVQLSTRYQQYCFAKRHLRGTRRPEVFPIGGSTTETALPIKQVAHRRGFATNMRTYDPDGISGTIDTAGGEGREVHVKIPEATKIRRLTPTECMRLQGFPDNWCDGVSDTQKYKCAGNAVTVNVIQAIMERLSLTPLT